MDILIIIIIFITGLLIGSFLNVVICRMDDIKSIITTRSHCPKCKNKLAWYDLIPLVSFIMLAQKCRYCGKQISWQYPLVELGTALMFVFLFLHFGVSVELLFYCFIVLLLMVVFVYDLYHQLIADEMIWSTLVLGVIYIIYSSLIHNSSFIILNSIYGAFIGSLIILILVLVTRGKGMGIGDIKLVFLLGLLTGWPKILICLFFAFTIGSVVGLALIAYKKKTLKSAIAFAPFLIIGFYITVFWGEKILNWYLK